ncbi:MAG: MFS transporter [SAR202 cluster bacterium]|nr:MFS transporter [SAR202 cluster bacterium]
MSEQQEPANFESPSPELQGARRGWLNTTLSSLSIPQYRLFWMSMILLFAGDAMTQVARPWFVYSETGSPILLGLTISATMLPLLVLSPVAGALADRFPKQRNLLVCIGSQVVINSIIAVDIWAGTVVWWHVLVAGVPQGVVMSFITPARRAIIADLVDQGHILNAVSLNTGTLNLSRMIAPAIGGFIIALLGIGAGYATISGLYVFALLLMLRVPSIRPEGRVLGESVVQAMGQGFVYVKRTPVVANLLFVGLIATIFGQPIQQLLPLFTEDVLDVGPEGLGVLSSLVGLGAFTAAMTSASLGDFRHKGWLLLLYTALMGAAIVLFSVSKVYALSLILGIPLGFGSSGRLSVNLAVLQAYSAPEMRGRVMALYNMQGGLMPAVILPVSALAGTVGAPVTMASLGLVVLVFGLANIAFNRQLRKLA